MKSDLVIETVRELVAEIDKCIKRLPLDQRADAHQHILDQLSLMPSQQALDELLEVLFPSQIPQKGRG